MSKNLSDIDNYMVYKLDGANNVQNQWKNLLMGYRDCYVHNFKDRWDYRLSDRYTVFF